MRFFETHHIYDFHISIATAQQLTRFWSDLKKKDAEMSVHFLIITPCMSQPRHNWVKKSYQLVTEYGKTVPRPRHRTLNVVVQRRPEIISEIRVRYITRNVNFARVWDTLRFVNV